MSLIETKDDLIEWLIQGYELLRDLHDSIESEAFAAYMAENGKRLQAETEPH